MKTIDYYNNNAQAFYDRTIGANLSEIYSSFLKNLTPNAHILDAGCGVGRDTKYFLEKGYNVSAFDASEEMVKYATKESGIEVKLLNFQDMNFEKIFDGVWANATLLHIPYSDTRSVYKKINNSLKQDGIFYASYKYGSDFMPTSERDFYNMTESTILPYLEDIFEVIDLQKLADTRSQVAPSPDQAWLYLIAKKLDITNRM